MPKLPPLLDWEIIQQRLKRIFKEGLTNRNYLVRDMSAKTVFVMLYLDTIEGNNQWLRPDQVTKMTAVQAAQSDVKSRQTWSRESMKPSREAIDGRWYAQNSREPIRDETIRQGLLEYGAVIEKKDLPTTSPKGRYALQADFPELFSTSLNDDQFEKTIIKWNKNNLSPSALARVALLRSAAVPTEDGVIATFPNGETRRLAVGPSSTISKAVVEEFAPRFLEVPGIIWLSESASKEDRRDSNLTSKLGLNIDIEKKLPDIILVDLGPKEPLFVFVEVVASDGPISEERKNSLQNIVTAAGYKKSQIAFITAYLDRDNRAFRSTFSSLAWQSYAWCMTEPDRIIGLHVLKKQMKLHTLVAQTNR